MVTRTQKPSFFFCRITRLGYSKLIPITKALPDDWKVVKVRILERTDEKVIVEVIKVE